ncbi:diphthine--ammonia ligase [Salinimicrobium sp. HB62]|uniref:Dph6-related ATP pyrophosphatase n=1 Tax=Salinimicrobium sp. HB62 TaxID=3077781 RepID=UPI002D785C92|nr:diphthine--ammonia ligase [Salinimicrobium sp. HB62]
MKKSFLNWSSGKDAAYALHLLQQQKEYEVHSLVTTINSKIDRVFMHGLRTRLLEQQAENLDIPIRKINLDGNVSMSKYNEIMEKETGKLKAEGFSHSIFGDIFLEDLREYREQQLQKAGLQALFPLWKMHTGKLMEDFLVAGFKAITVSVNAKVLSKSFCGREIDTQFLKDLPADVDPAGENGEFHSFVFDGPIFSKPITFQKGEIVERFFESVPDQNDNCFKEEPGSWDTRFYYCDLLPL